LWVQNLAAGGDGYLAVVSTETGAAVLQSADAATWSPYLDVDELQLPFGSAWFDRTASGGFGTFVLGSRDGWEPQAEEPQPVAFTKQGRTLTIDGPRYSLVDDESLATLFSFDEQAWWTTHEPVDGMEPLPPVRWGEGGLAIFADDGTLLFALSLDEQWQGDEWADPEEWYEPEQLLLRHDGTTWVSVDLPEDVGPYDWFAGVVVDDDRIVLVATCEGTGPEWSQRLIAFVGTA